jgi:hypothetical protein
LKVFDQVLTKIDSSCKAISSGQRIRCWKSYYWGM